MKSILTSVLLLTFIFLGFSDGTGEPHLKENLKKHITYLASDKLEGRFTGSRGAALARSYIEKEFKEIGLSTAPDQDSYEQAFDFVLKKEIGQDTRLAYGDKVYRLNTDYYPLAYSSNGVVEAEAVYVKYGIDAPDLGYNDYEGRGNLEGKIFIIEVSSPDGIHPHSKYVEYNDLPVRIEIAKKHGASAILFVNTLPMAEDPDNDLNTKTPSLGIPVLFLKNDDLRKEVEGKNLTLAVDIYPVESTGHNVVGYIDNNKPYTVVIGAHYDHLGHGWKGSLHAANDSAIHNGADDNASGVAMVIELARMLKNNKSLDKNNYMFIAFSGEELGLYGSKWFVDHSPVPMEKINYMINLDMVGRLDSNEVLIINGTGTAPDFSELDSLPIDGLRTKCGLSGFGPSDHSSFYLKDVPVIHFFTGTHEDYHKPSDDEYKINYDGMVKIYDYIVRVITELNGREKLTFTKTSGGSSEGAPKFSVTLGVIPDYTYSKGGMKIDGIREGKAADKAGIQAGDVIIKMGPVTVSDMMAYMKALGYFKAGDSTDVILIRNSDTMNVKVHF